MSMTMSMSHVSMTFIFYVYQTGLTFSCVAWLIRTPFVVKIESIKNEKRKHRTEGDVRMTKKSCLNYKTNFPLLSYRTEQSETLISPPRRTPRATSSSAVAWYVVRLFTDRLWWMCSRMARWIEQIVYGSKARRAPTATITHTDSFV